MKKEENLEFKVKEEKYNILAEGTNIYMKKIVSKLNDFDFDELEMKKSDTQKRSNLTEKFVEDIFKDIFENDIYIIKNGSQVHPDFYILKKSILESKIPLEKLENSKKSKKSIVDEIFENEMNFVLKIEVKSYAQKSNGKLIFNDTLPNPFEDNDTLYIFFDTKEKRVYLNTSFTMCLNENLDVQKKYNEMKNLLRKTQDESNEIWKGTSISTAIRPTFSTKISYFNFWNEIVEKNVEKMINRIK